MNGNKILSKNPDIVTRVIDNEVILVPIFRSSGEADCIYTLNESAKRVWDLIDGKRTLGQIKKQLLKEFDSSPQEIDEEIVNFLKELKEIKAIKCKN